MIAEADNAHDSVVEAETAESTTMTAAADAHSDPNLQAASPQVPAGCLNRGVVTHKTPPPTLTLALILNHLDLIWSQAEPLAAQHSRGQKVCVPRLRLTPCLCSTSLSRPFTHVVAILTSRFVYAYPSNHRTTESSLSTRSSVPSQSRSCSSATPRRR